MRHSIVFVGVVHVCERRPLRVSVTVFCVCWSESVSVFKTAHQLSLKAVDRRTETSSPRHPSFKNISSFPRVFVARCSQEDALE